MYIKIFLNNIYIQRIKIREIRACSLGIKIVGRILMTRIRTKRYSICVPGNCSHVSDIWEDGEDVC